MTDMTAFAKEYTAAGAAPVCPGLPRMDSRGCPAVWRLECVDSTLDAAHRLAQCGRLAVWESVQAVRQLAGRGQMRRQWQSPAGNIYATQRLPEAPPFTGSEATPALSLLLARAFADMGLAVRVKWPNDLTVEQGGQARKVAGILMEERGGRLYAGIGINVIWHPDVQQLRAQAAMPAASLADVWPGGAPACPTAESLWTALVKWLYSAYTDQRSLAEHWLESAERFLLWQGRRVRLQDGDVSHEGFLAGLHPDGGIRLRQDDGEDIFYSGSLSPVRQ